MFWFDLGGFDIFDSSYVLSFLPSFIFIFFPFVFFTFFLRIILFYYTLLFQAMRTPLYMRLKMLSFLSIPFYPLFPFLLCSGPLVAPFQQTLPPSFLITLPL